MAWFFVGLFCVLFIQSPFTSINGSLVGDYHPYNSYFLHNYSVEIVPNIPEICHPSRTLF